MGRYDNNKISILIVDLREYAEINKVNKTVCSIRLLPFSEYYPTNVYVQSYQGCKSEQIKSDGRKVILTESENKQKWTYEGNKNNNDNKMKCYEKNSKMNQYNVQ